MYVHPANLGFYLPAHMSVYQVLFLMEITSISLRYFEVISRQLLIKEY